MPEIKRIVEKESSPGLRQIVVSGAFDDLQSKQIRFLQRAAELGDVTVLVWPDGAVERFHGRPPKWPLAERLYFLNALRYVSRAMAGHEIADFDALPNMAGWRPDVWVDLATAVRPKRAAFCRQQGLDYHLIQETELAGFPDLPPMPSAPGRKKVMVTGCYDWLHSGHARFFEEAGMQGDLYVIVGHDANIRLLKGEGHPLLKQEERRYLVGSIKYVKQALISSGHGWMDAEPEIQELKPDIYVVNEDGDKGGKREYCRQNGIEYLVLQRLPAPGLPSRSSTELRGF
jgi:cytidyltransferase-like protein